MSFVYINEQGEYAKLYGPTGFSNTRTIVWVKDINEATVNWPHKTAPTVYVARLEAVVHRTVTLVKGEIK